jgi:hypothetical protein
VKGFEILFGEVRFTKGEYYSSEMDTCLTDNKGYSRSLSSYSDEFIDEWFKKINPEEVNDDGIRLFSSTLEFVQEKDTWDFDSDSVQDLKLEKIDAGGGDYYYILSSDRWAFDSIEELVSLIKKLDV